MAYGAPIVISGRTAAGKTTHGTALASLLGYAYYSASDVLREVVASRTPSAMPWGTRWSPDIDRARSTPEVDRTVDDRMLLQLGCTTHAVFDAAFLPWLHSDPAVLNVWIESDEPSRARKCYVSHLGERNLSLDQASEVVRTKDAFNSRFAEERYRTSFGPDGRFHLVASNSDLIPVPSTAVAARGAAIFSPILLSALRYLLGSGPEPQDPRILRLRAPTGG